MLSNPSMDNHRDRREKLLAIRDQVFEGSTAALARRLGKTDSYVARMLYDDDKKGFKRIGERSVATIEEAFGITRGIFDFLSKKDVLAAATRAVTSPSTDDSDSRPKELAPESQRSSIANPQTTEKSGTLSEGVVAQTLTSPQRLRASLGITGIAPTELASIAKVGADVASQWLAGQGPEISLEQAVAIQNTYGVNVVWLTRGIGAPGVAVRYNDEFRPVPLEKPWQPIPVVGMAQLGDNGHWADLEYPVGVGEGYVDFPTRDPNAYALKCEGDSMVPRIQHGEFVIIEPSQPVEPGDDVLLKSKDGRVMIKRFLYRRAGRTHVISVNTAHAPMAFSDDEIEKIHFVRAIIRPSAWRPE